MPLTAKQQVFVREYLIDMSPADAYLRAGYRVASREVAWKASSRLLKKVEVLQAIEKAQHKRRQRLEVDGDWVVIRLKVIYLEATVSRNYSAALRALENIGKFLGLFEKHNSQKRQYTQDDVETLKAELEAAGFNFEIAAYRNRGTNGTAPRDQPPWDGVGNRAFSQKK